MNKEETKIDFSQMKKERYSRTNILNRFTTGWASIIHSFGIERRIYRLNTNEGLFILKVINCSTKEENKLKEAKEEYELSLKAYKLSKGVAKPIKHEVVVQRVGDIASIESLYEYEGENLNIALKGASSKHIVNSMRQVINTMITLHENGIFHSDLKPTNIVYKEGKVKIIDFGVSMDFRSPVKLEDITRSPVIGLTEAFCPPEVICGKKYVRSKVDVYCWGMTLYQLIFRKSNREIVEEVELKRTNEGYVIFLNEIDKLEIKDDPFRLMKSSLLRILFRVFQPDYTKRPDFKELKKMFDMDDYYYREDSAKPTNPITTPIYPNEESKSTKEIMQATFDKIEQVEELFNELRVSVSDRAYEEVQKAYDRMYLQKCDKVYLYHLCIGDEGAMIIARGLLIWKNIIVLQLAFCKIGVPGAQSLSEGLEQNLKLKELYLGDHNTKFNNFDHEYDEDDSNDSNSLEIEGTRAICNGLRNAHSLEILDLSYCNVNSYAIEFIEKLTNKLKNLKLLYLDNNRGILKSSCKFRSNLNVKFDTI